MRIRMLCVVFLSLASCGLNRAQDCAPLAGTKVFPDPPVHAMYFGHSVAVNDEFMVVGANRAPGPLGEEFAGEVYVYKRSGTGYILHQRLFAPNHQPHGGFGWCMDKDDETLVIGAPLAPGAGGEVYVYSLVDGNWQSRDILQAIDGFCCGTFGFSVAVEGELIAVASPGSHRIVNDSGAVHTFHRSGSSWVPGEILVGSTTVRGDEMGTNLQIHRNKLIVGAQFHGEDPRWAGAAYVFVHDGTSWTEEAVLTQDDPMSSAYFGSRVVIHDGWAAISALGDDTFDTGSGAVYLFEFDGSEWSQHSKLVYENSNRLYNFGKAISLHEDTLVITSPSDDLGHSNAGVVYIYRRHENTWVLDQELRHSDPRDYQEYGNAVAINKNLLVVAAYRDDIPVDGIESGSAFLYDLQCPARCLADLNDDGLVGAADFTAWINAFNTGHPRCDQNNDGACTATDFTAWIANYNAGCSF